MLGLIARSGECSASELGKPFDAAQPTISKHIRVLEQAGLVSRRIDGRTHRFQLVVKPLKEAASWIATHQAFWENSLDALGEALDEITNNKQK